MGCNQMVGLTSGWFKDGQLTNGQLADGMVVSWHVVGLTNDRLTDGRVDKWSNKDFGYMPRVEERSGCINQSEYS